MIFSAYPFGNIYISLLLGKKMNLWGRKSSLYRLNQLLSLSYLLFSLSIIIENKIIFVLIGTTARFIQGIAVGGVCTICYSYIAVLFSDRFNQVIAYFELTIGFGIGFGPTLGDFFFYIFGDVSVMFFTIALLYFFY